jgi:5-hydroxytryptamine receptor 3
VEDIDLDLLSHREDITHDKKVFLNDSEWELLSVSSAYNILQSSVGDFAQIQFNVGFSPSCPIAHFSAVLSLLCWVEESLLCYISHSLSPKNSWVR